MEIRIQKHQINRKNPSAGVTTTDYLEYARPTRIRLYANVNPQVDHPRWSQASERFIGEGSLFSSRRQPTAMFNGYQDEVASLYSGMDLGSNF